MLGTGVAKHFASFAASEYESLEKLMGNNNSRLIYIDYEDCN